MGPKADISTYEADCARNVAAWRRGEARGPLMMEVFPTNRCNLQCKHCWQRTNEYDKTYKTELTDERLLRIVDEGHELGVRQWVIKGGGEPMARGKLVMNMFSRISELGMYGTLHTNGTLLKPEQIEALVSMGWFEVSFSIDGVNAENNDYLRSGGFDKAVTALRGIKAARERQGKKLPITRVAMVVTRTNYQLLDQMVELVHESGATTLGCGGMVEHTDLCNEFLLQPEDRAALPRYVRKAMKRADELGLVNNLESFLHEEITANPSAMEFGLEYASKRDFPDALCFAPFTEFVVHANGQIGPCCMSYDERANNLKDLSLREAWLGPYMTSVREHFLYNRPMSYCATCPTGHYTRIDRIRESLKDRVRMEAMNPAEKSVWLAARALESIKSRGVATTMQHAKKWVSVRMK